MSKYFAFDPINWEAEFFDTEEEALKFANEILDELRDEARSEGWSEETENIVVGVITHRATECDVEPIEDDNKFSYYCDFKMKKIK